MRCLILMTTYNGEKFIGQQIESICNQSFRDWHLIIRDDGSKDRTIGYGSVAMGEKQDELLIDGASYKSLIYNFGFLGFGISLVWLLVYSIHYKKVTKNRYIWVIFIIYLLNIYQRPSAFFPPYLMIALGGIEKLESDMKNSLNIKSIKDRNQLRQKEFETT